MFLFLKLYLAHLIGDFILQFEELYQLKVKSLKGHIMHVLMHLLVSIVLVLPYLKIPFMWVFLGSLILIHLVQDLIKYEVTKKYPQWTFILFTVDQIFHALVVSSIFLFPVSQYVLGFGSEKLDYLYLDSFWTLLAIAFILSTFGGSYFLNSFRKNYISDSRSDHYITSFEMAHGIIEKSFITGVFIFSSNPKFILFCPVIGLLRIFSKPLNNALDFFLSFVVAAVIGIIFRNLI